METINAYIEYSMRLGMDWSIPQTVLSRSKAGDMIVFTNGKCKENRFGGTVIKSSDPEHVGMQLDDFYKTCFVPCNIAAVINEIPT